VVAQSQADLGGVFLVRGMEGNYAPWLKRGGGVYDGFLLSAANGFPQPLHEIISWLAEGRVAEAQALSQRLTGLIQEMFLLVRGLTCGNAFANAGKAIDHFMAYGHKAIQAPPPRLHCGHCLPKEILNRAERALMRYDLMPSRGYLE
jgi:hypothetical protein